MNEKDLLNKFQEILQSQDIDSYVEMLKTAEDKDVQLYFNCLCELVDSFRSQFEMIVNNTLKILDNKNDLTKNKNISLNELKQIASEFRNHINFALGYELRRHPKYDSRIAETVSQEIREIGLVKYLDKKVDALHLGQHRNIYRKILGAFNIMRGKASYLFETNASSGRGKSLEDEIAFLKIIPQQYIFRKSSITYASFTRYSDITPYFFDRAILYLGDLGGKDSYKKIRDVFDVMKELITENYYSRDATDNINGAFEIKSMELIVTSIGAVYSTVKTNFTEDDDQLISRTIKSTVYPVKDDDLLTRKGYLNYSKSPESIEMEKAISELEKFKHYLLSLVNSDIEIINPFISVFMDYAKESEVITREFDQLLSLFDAYCILTKYDCQEKFIEKGYYVASQKQVNDFFNDIALENALIPIQSNFLKMLIGEKKDSESDGKKTKFALKIIDDNSDSLEADDDVKGINEINIYLNSALEDSQEQKTLTAYDEDTIITSIDYLDRKNQEIVINRLMKYYRLNGSSQEHKENVFFTVNDIKRVYSKYKPYKDIDNVSNLLNNLHKKGYLGKLEYKFKGNNIYYLTTKCENITKVKQIEDDDLVKETEFLSHIGIL